MYNQRELFGSPNPPNAGPPERLSSIERHILNVRALNEAQSIYANLLVVSDFKPDEIEDLLEWEPTDEQMEEIWEVVEFEQSNTLNKVPMPSAPIAPPTPVIF